jgi:hypothetical protein
MRYMSIVLLTALLAGCGVADSRYSLFETSGGALLLLDTRSGVTMELPTPKNASQPAGSGGSVPADIAALLLKYGASGQPAAADGRVQLKVGQFYTTESGDVVKYVGTGKFEPRPPLDSFFKK